MLRFDNRFVAALPADPNTENQPRQVAGAAYTRVQPTAVSAPELLAWSDEMGAELGLERPAARSDWLAALAGNQLLAGMDPYAMVYGGHQFGNWAGQLGDGRAIALGEAVAPSGNFWEMQLKGAGPTPYSRTADGRAVLRSSLREFLCSEAMHHLGVPTTRALSLVSTGDQVVRDMFYDGNAHPEPGAIVCRVAPSFIRFGNFQLPASRGDYALLKQLADFTIRTHFPELDADDPQVYAQWFAEVSERTARMVVDWMRVGFVHGVMNTDNMSIHGLTIDYGPYGWLEPYDPHWTPNTTDAEGRRYRFGNQATIAHWNLAQFGNALVPLVDDVSSLQAELDRYTQVFDEVYRQQFAAKLGLPSADEAVLQSLLQRLFTLLARTETDYCLFFRQLARMPFDQRFEKLAPSVLIEPLHEAYYANDMPDAVLSADLVDWLNDYLACAAADGMAASARRNLMNRTNPKYVLRNYLAQQAIDAAERGDASELETLQKVLSKPYDEQPEFERYAARRPEWARHRAGCSALSCSS